MSANPVPHMPGFDSSEAVLGFVFYQGLRTRQLLPAHKHANDARRVFSTGCGFMPF
jgi:hypothetical protein